MPDMERLVHGVDIVEVARIRAMLQEHGERFLKRCFTPEERVYCDSKADAAIHYAGRFAAKEAVFKALGTGLADGLTWLDCAVGVQSTGQPTVELTGRARMLAALRGFSDWSISISHTGELALASVVARASSAPG